MILINVFSGKIWLLENKSPQLYNNIKPLRKVSRLGASTANLKLPLISIF